MRLIDFHLRVATMAAALLALGCGASDGDPSPDDPGVQRVACGPAVPEADAGRRWAQSFCQTLFSCTCDQHARYATEAECIEAEEAAWNQVLGSATAAGATYDGECVGCLIEFFSEDLACSSDLNVFMTGCPKTSCSIFTGRAAEGEACTAFSVSAGTCAPGLWCNPASKRCQAWQCQGRPTNDVKPKLGERCADDDGRSWTPCTPDDEVVCDVTGSKVCEPLPAKGATCIFGKCRPGLVCYLDFPGPTETCTDPVPQGGTCHVDAACGEGLHCDMPNSATGGTCAPKDPDGARCRADQHCQSGYCKDRFVQGGANAQCAPMPGDGEPCQGICAQGLACDMGADPAVCRHAGGVDEPCRGAEPKCDDGLSCTGTRCVAPAALGEDCEATRGLCVPGTTCNPSTMVCERGEALICDVQ